DPASVAAHHGGDVLLQDRRQLVVADLPYRDPVRVLRVPHQGVAADALAVGDGEVDHLVGGGEVVAGRLGVDEVPLQLVLGGERGELGGQLLAQHSIVGEGVGRRGGEVVSAAGRNRADEEAGRRRASKGGVRN